MNSSLYTLRFCLMTAILSLSTIMGLNGQSSVENRTWYHDTYRKLFFDYHTYQAARDVAARFDAGRWAEQLEDAHVQAVSIHALCFRGWRYYREGTHGYVHPKLPEDLDMIEEQIRACHEKDIKVIAYFNVRGGEAATQYHPEWLMRQESGDTVKHTVSLFSPYFDQMLLPVLEEFSSNYDVDGLFFDFLYVSEPDDVHAKQKFVRDTGNKYPKSKKDPVWETYIEWLLSEGKRLRKEAIDAVHRGDPDILVSINWSYTFRQPEIPPDDLGFLSLDILPYDQVSEASFIAKNWATLDKPFDTMNSAFLAWWGDWGVKPAETMKQECAAVMANGGRTWIGYQIRPEFFVEDALMEEYRKTFEFVKEREEICKDAETVPYIAILNSSAAHFTGDPTLFIEDTGLRALYRMLLENGIQFNILDEKTLLKSLKSYELVILPGQRYIGKELADALREFVHNGKSVIATGFTGTQDPSFENTASFVLGDLFGIEYKGEYEFDHSYIKILDSQLKKEVLDMPQQAFGPCVLVENTTATVLGELWDVLLMEDGRFIHGSSPQDKYTGYPAITINDYGSGKAAYLSHDIFYAYAHRNQWNLKNMFINLIDMVIPEKIIEADVPSTVEVVLMKKGEQKQVHLVNHYRDKRPGHAHSLVEHVLPVTDLEIKLLHPENPRSVRVMPENRKLDHQYRNGKVIFTVPKLQIYSIVVVE